MSFIDWDAAEIPAKVQGEQNANNTTQLEQLQKQRALSALRGIDIGDQGSVQRGINALTGLGMADQATALTNLAQTRALNTASLPVATNALGMANDKISAAREASSEPDQPDIDAQHRQILQQGADATKDLLSYDDPALRAAAAAVYKDKFLKMGLPEQNIDEVLGDLSDQGLQAHEKFLTAAANGDTSVPHPTGYAATQSLLNSDPIYRNAQGQLTGPLADPLVQGVLSKYAGIDMGPGLSRAAEVTAPARAQAAGAAFAPVTSEASARGSAIGAGSVGSPPVAGARLTFDAQGQPDAWILPNGTTQAIQRTAQAGANITTAPPGGHVTSDASGNPTGVAPTTGYADTAASTAATVGAAGVSGPAAAQQLQADRQAASNAQAQMIPLRKVYDLLPTTNTGPGVQATNGWRSFLHSQLPILDKLIPGFDERTLDTAKTDELRKYMVQIAGAQAAQYGQGTNEKLAVAASGNPNIDMSNLASRDVTRMNIALLRAQEAKTAAFDQTGLPQTAYPQWATQYARTVDPRAFMLDLLSAPERASVLKTITTTADKRAFIKGKQTAEQAGIFTEGDIPR